GGLEKVDRGPPDWARGSSREGDTAKGPWGFRPRITARRYRRTPCGARPASMARSPSRGQADEGRIASEGSELVLVADELGGATQADPPAHRAEAPPPPAAHGVDPCRVVGRLGVAGREPGQQRGQGLLRPPAVAGLGETERVSHRQAQVSG